MRALVVAVLLAACGSTTPPARQERPAPVDAAPALVLDLALPITELRVTGLGPRTAAARAAITTKVGDVIDLARIRADQAALWGLGHVAALDVTAVAAAGGVELVFAVAERPRVRKVTIAGATQPHELGIAAGDPFDPAAAHRERDALIERYREAGYAFADARWSVAATGDGVELTVDVTEGARVEIRKIAFRGNKRFTAEQLLATLARSTGAAVGQPYVPDALDAGVPFLNSEYFDVGHVEIEIGAAEATFDAGRGYVDLVIPIAEGARHEIGKITFHGQLVDTEKHALAILGVKTGQVFSRSKLAAGIAALTTYHQHHGQPRASIEPHTEIDAAKHTVDLTISIE